MPWIQGCTSRWTDESRATHYTNLVQMDGRIVLAGEHATYYGGWMEGSGRCPAVRVSVPDGCHVVSDGRCVTRPSPGGFRVSGL